MGRYTMKYIKKYIKGNISKLKKKEYVYSMI